MTLRARVRARRGSLELDVDLVAGESGVLAVLGPNGAGKTSLLRVLAGLTPLSAGRIELDGRALEDVDNGIRLAPERRPVGVVFQGGQLFPHLTVLDNVAFGLRARGIDRRTARSRSAAMLEELGVGDLGAQRPRALSGGQAQRVAVARALVGEPRLLLLDEPLASVDTAARVELRRLLRARLTATPGVRLLVTHDPLEAAVLADGVVVIEEGRVTQTGTFQEVTARPRSPWTARIAGVNLLRGDGVGDGLRLVGGAVLAVAGDVSGPVLATIHPRAVALHRERPGGSPRNVLACSVVAVDREGDRWRVQLDGPVPLVAEVTSAAAADLRLAEGGPVFAAVKATEVDVYPA